MIHAKRGARRGNNFRATPGCTGANATSLHYPACEWSRAARACLCACWWHNPADTHDANRRDATCGVCEMSSVYSQLQKKYSQKMRKLTIEERWRYWRETLGSPKYCCAPMVLQSELAFRILVRRHGVTLCYAPMLPVSTFLASPAGEGSGDPCEHSETGGPCTQDAWFTTDKTDRPTLAQLGGSEPSEMLAAAKIIEDRVDGVDVNFGCPQRCAQVGGYGSFLMDDPERARIIVETLVAGLRVPVTAKIRILPTTEATIAFARMLEAAGVAALAVHGRTRDMKQHEGAADWSVIAAVKAALSIPIIANGNIRCKADADECMRVTGADGVMSATALLANPRLFSAGTAGTAEQRRAMALEYLSCCSAHPAGALPRMISDHILTILRPDFTPMDDEGRRLTPTECQETAEGAWKVRLKKRAKDWRALRTPEQFAEEIVRTLERGYVPAQPHSIPTATHGGEALKKTPPPPQRGRRGRPFGNSEQPAVLMDASSIARAVKSGMKRRHRRATDLSARSCSCTWGWILVAAITVSAIIAGGGASHGSASAMLSTFLIRVMG